MHHTPAMIRTSFLSAGLLASPLLFAADSGWPDQVAVSGTIESALGSSTDYNDDTGSGIDVPTVELVFDAVINPRVSANLGFKYEEGKTDFGIDTAYIDYRIDALTLTMGRVYLPFGSYETQQITGTLPSEIGEARHSVGMASLWHGSVQCFGLHIQRCGRQAGYRRRAVGVRP
ncbi:MAG: hypothetical protein CMI00_04375 [Oceanospirillaceae bacterium]|nr:hypothetical protein [Oceanospirillaceae bacterium]